MSAIREAISHKRAIEKELRDRLRKFSADTGLLVESVSVSALETTNLDSEFREWGDYRVDVRVTIE
jgi:hypothetical protein